MFYIGFLYHHISKVCFSLQTISWSSYVMPGGKYVLQEKRNSTEKRSFTPLKLSTILIWLICLQPPICITPTRFPKLLLFIATSTFSSSLLLNVPFAAAEQQQCCFLVCVGACFHLWNCPDRLCFEMGRKVFRTGLISLLISHLFVYCVLFGIYCFAPHPEHLGQHAGILGQKCSFPCPDPCIPIPWQWEREPCLPCMGCVLEPLLCKHALHLLA